MDALLKAVEDKSIRERETAATENRDAHAPLA
jgi:hypothetical protein